MHGHRGLKTVREDREECGTPKNQLYTLINESDEGNTLHSAIERCKIPGLLTIKEVRPTWQNLSKFSASKGDSITSRGVHHPKYVIIFTDAGLHVTITTSNLTKGKSLDHSWTQFFPKKRRRGSNKYNSKGSQQAIGSDNDFGAILQDFLIQVQKN